MSGIEPKAAIAQGESPAAQAPTSASADRLPSWFPSWARELGERYVSGTTCLFVLHGNVHDLMPSQGANGETFCGLNEFLSRQVFGSWNVVLGHDLSRGLRPMPGGDPQRLQSMLRELAPRLGSPGDWPRDPEQALLLLDKYIERSLVEESPEKQRSIAILLEYAQYLVPAGDLAGMAGTEGSRLVRMLGWAQNPYIKRANVAFCLIADKLSEVNHRLVQNPHVSSIAIPLPSRDERERFIRWTCGATPVEQLTEFNAAQLADTTAGLSLVNLQVVLKQGQESKRKIDAARFRQLKKSLIEQQCQGLVEFVEPSYTLDLLIGHEAAKARLREDARWVAEGQSSAAPMGYLISGPVGTGKTFLAECYAGSIGIPCVKLRNFRSKYVGETEGNLEQVLNVLRSLGPVVVIIDEADAALGSRRADGDSGTSSRVFSMIASQMGDTKYRGKIVWMLLTCRPDLLPIDLKRQGRAEVHIPLLYPESPEDSAAMIRAMAKKNQIELPEDAVPEVPTSRHLSGADLESIVLAAAREARAAGRKAVSRDELQRSLDSFLPSVQGLEKELQELAAVLECTELKFLPAAWQEKVLREGGRSQMQERLVAIRQLLSE